MNILTNYIINTSFDKHLLLYIMFSLVFIMLKDILQS